MEIAAVAYGSLAMSRGTGCATHGHCGGHLWLPRNVLGNGLRHVWTLRAKRSNLPAQGAFFYEGGDTDAVAFGFLAMSSAEDGRTARIPFRAAGNSGFSSNALR